GVAFARIASENGGDLRGEQAEDDAVLIGGPHGAVATTERRAGALLAGKRSGAARETVDKPLEADGNLHERALETLHHAIDHAAADDRLAHTRRRRPVGAMREQII